MPSRDLIERKAREAAEAAAREDDLQLELAEVRIVITPDRLAKSVEELVGNAFKFSTAGSPVRVVTRTGDHQFMLVVTDRGRGMTAEQIASVGAHMQFERRFYEQQGAGLGLIIARRIAQLHGGDLMIESEPGQLTSVQFSLPLPREGWSTSAGPGGVEPTGL
jgi:signal transduction histidine kinase